MYVIINWGMNLQLFTMNLQLFIICLESKVGGQLHIRWRLGKWTCCGDITTTPPQRYFKIQKTEIKN